MKRLFRELQPSIWLLFLFGVLAVPFAVAGPEEEEAPLLMMDSSTVVKAGVTPARLCAQRGDTVRVEVSLEVDPKWHLYAHEDTVFYGIDLELAEEPPLQEIAITYPPGEPAEFFGEKVQVLHGRQVIKLSGVVGCGLDAGDHSLELQVAVQACDNTRCLAPAFLPLAVKLELGK